MRKQSVRFEGSTLLVGQERLALRSGAFHYFRQHPSKWAESLQALSGLGLRIVESYVPWGVHERAPGDFDFGQHEARLNLGAFIDAVEAAGLYCFLRPGPHINAELTHFGLPERVVQDPAMLARSPRGNPVVCYFPPRMFAVPSYSSRAYLDAVAEWYAAVGEVVAPRLYPKGPVVLLQVDNEAGFYFRNGPFCQDYHPDSVELWHTFAAEHGLGSKEEPAEPLKRFGEGRFGETPSPEELRAQLLWASFQEHSLTRSIATMKRSMQRAGLSGVPFVHNLALGDGGLPVRVPALQRQVDRVGFDYYHSSADLASIKRRTLYLDANTDGAFAPELGVGAPPWFTPLKNDDSLFTAMAAAAFGLRAFNLYMAVDRDRWYGAVLDGAGRSRRSTDVWARFVAALDRTRFHTLHRRCDVALVVPSEYVRLTRATHTLGLVSPSVLEAVASGPAGPTAGARADDLGLGRCIQRDWWTALERVAAALTDAGVPYTYLDGESSARYWRPYRVLFSPSFRFADVARWASLHRAKAHAVVGPELPTRGADLRPATFASLECVDVFDERALRGAVIDWIDRFELQRPYAVRGPVLSAVHGSDSGDAVLFLINGSERDEIAEVRLPHPTRARDLMTDETFEGDETLSVHVPARTVRFFEL
ncbi:MAG: beta-galactosidase, partial [Myxococcota bacterium]